MKILSLLLDGFFYCEYSINTIDMEYFQSKVVEYRDKDSFIKERKKYPKYLLLYVG